MDECSVPSFIFHPSSFIRPISLQLRSNKWLLIAAISAVTGCGVIGKPSIKPPAVNPSRAASEAVELCDKDANRLLDAEELATCPGLLAALDKYDTSGDQQLDKDEIAARLSEMYSSGAALTSFDCRVLLDNRPVSGAQVRLLPEPFLGGSVKSGSGVTDRTGSVTVAIADEELPETVRGLKKMQLGVYRVEITHPSIKIPVRYNTHTTLGHEIHLSEPEEPVVFRLRSK
jgi:hypothetical protein